MLVDFLCEKKQTSFLALTLLHPLKDELPRGAVHLHIYLRFNPILDAASICLHLYDGTAAETEVSYFLDKKQSHHHLSPPAVPDRLRILGAVVSAHVCLPAALSALSASHPLQRT